MNSPLYTDQAGFPLSTKVEEFKDLLKYPEVQECLKDIIRNCLHESDLFIRLDMIEENLGADEFHCVGRDLAFERGVSVYDDEREPLPKVKELIAGVYNAVDGLTCSGSSEVVYVSGNETEIRARLLHEKLPAVGYRNGKRFLDSKEVQHFLLHEVPEEHRTTEKASRKVANDVMKKAVEMFPEVLKLTKNSKGINIVVFLENVNGCKF